MNKSTSLIWKGRSSNIIPSSVNQPDDIVPFAVGLSTKQQKQIMQAFSNQAYDMGAEYVWKRSMVRLRTALSGLGMNFIGELLGRDDIDESSSIESVLTDYSTIILAEQLGVIGSTGSLKLKHALEIINHYFSINNFERDDEGQLGEDNELTFIDAFAILSTCVRYVLGEYDVSVAIEFSAFRDKLLRGTLGVVDEQVQQVIAAPPFYKSTVISILLTAIRDEKGAKQEHALANLNALVSALWNGLPEKDKWAIGSAYRDVVAAGNAVIANGIRSALLKVAGFDYVPENLRSSTFIKYAKQLVDVHFSYDNFFNEVASTRSLANLGSVIPPAAFIDCMQAYLCVYLGNQYGHSFDAAPIAEAALSGVSRERWEYYFSKVLQTDEIILYKLLSDKPLERFKSLVVDFNLKTLNVDSSKVAKLFKAIVTGRNSLVKTQANLLYKALLLLPSQD